MTEFNLRFLLLKVSNFEGLILRQFVEIIQLDAGTADLKGLECVKIYHYFLPNLDLVKGTSWKLLLPAITYKIFENNSTNKLEILLIPDFNLSRNIGNAITK